MKKGLIVLLVILGVLGIAALFFSGTYNELVRADETVKQAWAQVENVYQRRLDLIPNLVESVKGYAAHEKSTFVEVTEARAKAAGSLNPGVINDPAKFQEFQQSQTALSSALSRLMVVVEKYPDLKANENFLALQTQLEGTENRISVERGRFNEAVRDYNTATKRFPSVLFAAFFGFKEKPYFAAREGSDRPPEVKFNFGAPTNAPARP